MKIINKKTVVRYHVELDEEETILLKKISFLPPHAAPRARLWWTAEELSVGTELLEKAKALP